MRSLFPALIVTVMYVAPGVAQDVDYTGSLQFSSGSYIFTSPTRTLSLMNGLSVSTDRLRLAAHVPIILQNSGAVTLVGGTMLPTGGTGSGAVGGRQQGRPVPMGRGTPRTAYMSLSETTAVTDSTVEGPGAYRMQVGDPFAAVSVQLYGGAGGLRLVEVTAGMKVPVTDLESGVGTGEWDRTVGLAMAVAAGPALVFVDAGYWWYGDLDELELQDGLGGSVAVSVPVSSSVWLSGSVMGSNRVIATAAPARTAALGVSYQMTNGTNLSVLAGAGLSESSPDAFVSFGWRLNLRRSVRVP